MHKNGFIIILLSIFSLLEACSSNGVVFHSTKEFPDAVWNMDSIATFEFEVTDTSSFYYLFIETQNTNLYSYSNIWFFTHIKTQKEKILSDTLEYSLCDKKGKWFGQKSDDNYKLWNLYKANVRFASTGIYHMEIQQGMRMKLLPGIKSVGLVIQKNEK